MIDEYLILTAERLRDDLAELKALLRRRYRSGSKQVRASEVKTEAARLAEIWLVDLAGRSEVTEVVNSDYLADLNVRFQRILTHSEHARKRSSYDSEIKAILDGFSLDLIIPLKQMRHGHEESSDPTAPHTKGQAVFEPSAFVGHSFAQSDNSIVECVCTTLELLGIAVTTGKQPRAKSISEKVKHSIENNYLFVGIFTRREKIARKHEWVASPWIIDEKAYAVGKRKKLILLREDGVGSIGGIQGDYEFLEFDRDNLQELVLSILRLFDVEISGLLS